MQLFVKYFEGLTLKLAWLAAWLLVISCLMLIYEVVPLYFFLAPTKWAAELSHLFLMTFHHYPTQLEF